MQTFLQYLQEAPSDEVFKNRIRKSKRARLKGNRKTSSQKLSSAGTPYSGKRTPGPIMYNTGIKTQVGSSDAPSSSTYSLGG